MAGDNNLTAWLALLIGLYAFAAGLGGFAAPDRWRKMLRELIVSPTLQFLAGIAAFVIGATIVTIQPLGPGLLAIIVAVVGWVSLVEGLILLAMPMLILGWARGFMNSAVQFWALFSMLIGAAMIVAGGVALA